jgi:hypothetical protein
MVLTLALPANVSLAWKILAGTRVTRKMNKNSPNILKCSQNWSQNIKAQIEGPKHQHPTAFDVKISTTNHVLKLLI